MSSLDDERRAYIATRLVEEAAHRQVIVFTHDMPFLLDLEDQAEAAGVEPLVQGVWRRGSLVGHVDGQPPFKAMNFKQRLAGLKQDVQNWDAGRSGGQPGFDAEWDGLCAFYRKLRTTWERGVEERLFRGVVQRLQRAVKTQSLDEVRLTPEIIALVKQGMDRCALFVHDDPPAATVP